MWAACRPASLFCTYCDFAPIDLLFAGFGATLRSKVHVCGSRESCSGGVCAAWILFCQSEKKWKERGRSAEGSEERPPRRAARRSPRLTRQLGSRDESKARGEWLCCVSS